MAAALVALRVSRLLLLLSMMVLGVTSEPQSLAARSWTDVRPVAAPDSVESGVPSLLSCLRHCLLRGPTTGCAALLHDCDRNLCLMYSRAACDAEGGGLQVDDVPSRYVELSPAAPRPASPDCPLPADAADQCVLLCSEPDQPAAGDSWTLLGHQLPTSVDGWTSGDIWSSLWKQITDQQCQIDLGVTSNYNMIIDLATELDESTVKLSIHLHRQAVVIMDRTNGGTYPVTLSEPLLQPPALTALSVGWCAGQVRISAVTSTAHQVVRVNLTLPDDLQFVRLKSYPGSGVVGHWRLGAHLVDPWLTSEQGWTHGRVYTVPKMTVLWRRVSETALATTSVGFDCAGSGGCQVFFKEQFHHPLVIAVIIMNDIAYVELKNVVNISYHQFSLHSCTPVHPVEFQQFFVRFTEGIVELFDYLADGSARLVLTQNLMEGSSYAQPPTRVGYVGLGARLQSASFNVFDYDPDWGQENGFSAGAGLLTEEESLSLMVSTC
ncbi:hypothetical protein FJT64_004347 [Amphibalanus amphitrite]|uniref:Uncharacterized protein n=1 Tax=Amphibalanus amphitrite TaxID=1232801 RepID=A0A6A4W3H0_AMPAM|nr:hypothetical protein FJT64_004347 [Amphibalanus amphitrite]